MQTEKHGSFVHRGCEKWLPSKVAEGGSALWSPAPRLLLLPRLLLTQLCGGLGSVTGQPGLVTRPLCPSVMSAGTMTSLTGECCVEGKEAPHIR